MTSPPKRRLWRWLGYLGLGLVALVLLVPTYLWFGPLPFDWFFNRAFVQVIIDQPETLSDLRILEPMGITFHQDDLNDESEAAEDKTLATLKHINGELHSYSRDGLSYQQKLSYDMTDWLMARLLAAADRFRYHSYPLNQLFGIQNEFPSFMDSTHQVNSVGDAEDYVSRLSKVKVKFEQVLEGLHIREQKGIIPPTFVIEKVLAEMEAFVAEKPEQNILYSSLQKKLKKAKLGESDQKRILAATKQEITRTVYPAYGLFIAYFKELKPKSSSDAGVWKLPDGDKYYRDVLELYTTTQKTPDEVHELGLSEVTRIQGEMRTILAAQGYDTSNKTVGELMSALGEEPRFLYPDTAAGREQILKDYQKIIDDALKNLDKYFNKKPKMGVKVERVPEFKQKTAPGGYYQPPPMDGTQPGKFYANLYDIKATPTFDMRTLAYHEAVPGHHFQIALAQELNDLPLFRRMAPFVAYAEGWALYSERLAWEAGFEQNPFDNLGRLQAELFRAVRLVVDTGIHKKRWTREQAIDYMRAQTGMAESDVVAEIERYIVMPGQACAYKLGMMEILRLRSKAHEQLGDNFDIREFHEVVLSNGALPLFLLERVVDDWIKQQKTAKPPEQREKS
jgi:uncharacterized protein (DUF885 family)